MDLLELLAAGDQRRRQLHHRVAAVVGAKAAVAKVNIDENTATAAKYGIRSIPTLLLFKNGQVAQQFVGLQRKEQLLAAIEAQAGA